MDWSFGPSSVTWTPANGYAAHDVGHHRPDHHDAAAGGGPT